MTRKRVKAGSALGRFVRSLLIIVTLTAAGFAAGSAIHGGTDEACIGAALGLLLAMVLAARKALAALVILGALTALAFLVAENWPNLFPNNGDDRNGWSGAPVLRTEYASRPDYDYQAIGVSDYTGTTEYRVRQFVEVEGETRNTGTATAHDTYVRIDYLDPSGMLLHQKNIPLGDLVPGAARPFKDRWPDDTGRTRVKAKSHCREVPY